jgi:beta-glucanase (GH16 family)
MKKSILVTVFLLGILRGPSTVVFAQKTTQIIPYPTPVNPVEKAGWELVFQDEFEGDTLKSHWWPQDSERPGEWAVFTSRIENVSIDSGQLNIIVRKESYKNFQYTGGLIFLNRTIEANTYAEAACRIPIGDGLWPAFWFWIGSDSTYQEMDVLENYGKKTKEYDASHHYWNDILKKRETFWVKVFPKDTLAKDIDLSSNLHVFAVEWKDDKVKYFMDNVVVFEFTQFVPKKPLNLILGMGLKKKPKRKVKLPAKFEIDYVRVYKLSKN